MSEKTSPAVVMAFLNRLFTAFDALVEARDVYKVETIGASQARGSSGE